jgi:glycosyltransferase involved in cell wall biosynthesis
MKVPAIVRFHGTDIYEEIPENEGYIPYREYLLSHLSCAVFISEFGMNYIKNKYSHISFRAELFRLGVSDQGISSPSSDNVLRLVTCSNILHVKRLDILLGALSMIKINVCWTHIGDGPLRQDLLRKIQVLPKNISAQFLGQMPNEMVRKNYIENCFDLFLCLSRSEGIPVSIMEALAAGIPVFATRVGGIPELVDDSVGKLLPISITPDILKEELLDYYYLPERSKNNYRENARKRWSAMADEKYLYTDFAKFLVKYHDSIIS